MSAIKKAVKKIGKFIKKHWKKIVVAAAVVFTAGVATVGFAGLKAAVAAKGLVGGLGATLQAGAASIAGTFGIGGGVTAQTAGAAFANAPVLAGASQGLTLGTGAAAQSLGFAAKTGAAAGQTAAKTATAAASNAKAGAAAKSLTGATKTAATKAAGSTTAANIAGSAGSAGSAGAVGSAGSAGSVGAAGKIVGAGAGAGGGGLASSGFWATPAGQALVQGGIGAATTLLAGEQDDEYAPKGFFGVDLQGDRSLSREQMSFRDPNITGGYQSFRRPLMYDEPEPQGG